MSTTLRASAKRWPTEQMVQSYEKIMNQTVLLIKIIISSLIKFELYG